MKIASGIVGLTLAANTNPDKPNVLFILSDDQGRVYTRVLNLLFGSLRGSENMKKFGTLVPII